MPSLDLRSDVKLSVVIPAYNEEATLAAVIRKLLDVPYLFEIVIVDDCSTDATQSIVARLATEHVCVRTIRHKQNLGKTGALKSGFAATTGDIVIVQDADLEYDPLEIKDIIQPIVDGFADVVYGSRFSVYRANHAFYLYHYLANRFLTLTSNLLTNVAFSDVETGYKAIRGEIIRNMVITSTGFGFEVEVTAKVSKLGCAIFEVPISYHGRTYQQGKKISYLDGIAALWYIFQYNWFTSLRESYRTIPALCQTPFRELSDLYGVRQKVGGRLGCRSAERRIPVSKP
jgi:glycosyltransferase involved in cell wall biosynthesis